MATIRSVWGILCLALCWSFTEPSGNFLVAKSTAPLANYSVWPVGQTGDQTVTVLAIAQSQLGVREETGHNDGPAVEKYLAYTGNAKGDPWCAAFVSWVFGQAGYKAPRTAWSPALFPTMRLSKAAMPATVFGIYFADKQRIAHAGLVERKRGNWVYTIEGNTNLAGAREGDGVYRKLRHLNTIAAFANWLPKAEGALP